MPLKFTTQHISKEVLAILNDLITADFAFKLFKLIADTPSPSQTLQYGRGPVIQQLLLECSENYYEDRYQNNFKHTGNDVVVFGDDPQIIFFAHADEISYLVGETDQRSENIPLIPFCKHKASSEHPAKCLHFDYTEQKMVEAATGTIFTKTIDGQPQPFFHIITGKVEPGDRVIFAYDLTLQGDLIYGKHDNAAGVMVSLLALTALAKLQPEQSAWFVFTDEEEGLPDGNSMFGRGTRRFLRQIDLPANTLVVNIDGQDYPPDSIPSLALLAEKESNCKGAVTTPDLYTSFKAFAKLISEPGMSISENTGYVSRSDASIAMEYFRNILLLGYPSVNAHFNEGIPCTSLNALVSLAKVIVLLVLGYDKQDM